MYFYKRGQFQAVGIRANNLDYRPGSKIFPVELFLEAGSFDIFRIQPKLLAYIKSVGRLALEPWHRNCAAAGAGLRSCPAAWRCHMTAGGGSQNTTTGSCCQSFSPLSTCCFSIYNTHHCCAAVPPVPIICACTP
jgi:hypothetical protein